jgi:hypothetical protein
MKNTLSAVIGIMCLAFLSTGTAVAQVHTGQVDIETLKKSAPKVFIDCGMCDIEYIKTEITFVNYVRATSTS